MAICEFEGCTTALRSHNKIGYCRPHRNSSPAKKAYMADYYTSNPEKYSTPCVRCGEPCSSEVSGLCRTCYWEDHEPVTPKSEIQRAMLHAIKLAAGCADCGYSAHHAALDFDHIPGRGKKLFTIGASYTMSWARLEAEMAKCEIVCANCHRVRTHNRRQEP